MKNFILKLYRKYSKWLAVATIMVFMFALMVAPAAAQSSGLDLTIDVQPLFDGIETFLPVAISVFGLIGGVAIAFNLARYIVNSFLSAFSGGNI